MQKPATTPFVNAHEPAAGADRAPRRRACRLGGHAHSRSGDDPRRTASTISSAPGPASPACSSRDLRSGRRSRRCSNPPAWTAAVVPGFDGTCWAPDIVDARRHLLPVLQRVGGRKDHLGDRRRDEQDARSPIDAISNGSTTASWCSRFRIAIYGTPSIRSWCSPTTAHPGSHSDRSGRACAPVRLAPDRLRVAEPQEWRSLAKRERSVLIDDAEPEPASIEAPFIFRKNG